MTEPEQHLEQAWDILAEAVRDALPLVEEIVKQRQIFAKACPQSSKIVVQAEAEQAERTLNALCIALLDHGGKKRW